MMTPPDAPKWGKEWKTAIRKHYRHSAPIGAQGSVMSYRDRYLSLDPTYKDGHGLPLLRLTFDWHDNEYKMAAFSAARVEEIVRVMKPEQQATLLMRPGDHYDVRIYQSTHTTGGAIIGTNPSNSFINRYSQSWDVSNLFVMGASAFPQNIGYNPTGLLAGTRLFLSRENSRHLSQVARSFGARMRWRAAIAFAGVAGVCGLLGVMGISYLADRTAGETNLVASKPSPELIARGEYLARLGDCAACHSVPGRPAFAGGLRMAIPIGAIYTTNITPDPVNGIGRFSLTDFDRALRFGVAGGHSLYPAMPFPSYANTKPEDVAALYAYFKYGVAAAATPNITNDIVFPLSMRWPLTFWRLLFAPKPTPFEAQAEGDPIIARGAYFVEGLGHCGECHTPRNLVMQVKAQTPSQGSAFLSGAVIENYFAPSLRNGGPDTLGGWSESDIADFLTTGANPRGIVFGSMTRCRRPQHAIYEPRRRRCDGAISQDAQRARGTATKILRLRRNGTPGVKARRCEQARRSSLP